MLNCLICGKPITDSFRQSIRKYCSKECYRISQLLRQRKDLIKKCSTCGKEISSHSRHYKYCSKECLDEYMRRVYRKAYKGHHRLELIEKAKKKAQEYKKLVFEHYGGIPPFCVCCGELHNEFLSLDHINGRRCKDRRELKLAGASFYRWLVQHDYPEGYQILCMNCNHAKSNHKQRLCPVHHPELYAGP